MVSGIEIQEKYGDWKGLLNVLPASGLKTRQILMVGRPCLIMSMVMVGIERNCGNQMEGLK